MILYALEVGLIWFVLYIVYAFFLQKERFFELNRSYLLIALLAGLFLPFIEIETNNNYLWELPVFLNEITVNVEKNIIASATQNLNWNYEILLLLTYILGAMIGLLRLSSSLFKIWKLYKNASIKKYVDYSLVKTNEIHSPFSFGSYLFISDEVKLNTKAYQYIVKHETTHIFQKHTFDILLIELLSILFWFNPLLVLYKTALQDQHEYLADQAVLKNASIKEYGQLLIEQSIPGLKIRLVNHLIYSQLKKRINMMTKKHVQGIPYLRYTTSLIALGFVFWTISCQKETIEKSNDIHTLVKQMPFFKSDLCQAHYNHQEKKQCSDQQLLKFIYENIKYPPKAKENETEGLSVISFVVTAEGNVTDFKILKDPGNGCGIEALRVARLMQGKKMWVPGIQDGKLVNVKYNLPIRFKLK